MHLEILKISHGEKKRFALDITEGHRVSVGDFVVFCSAGGKVQQG